MVSQCLVYAKANEKDELTVKNIEGLKEYGVYNNKNIMLYNEDGKIISEFQSDGNEVNYIYDKNSELKESFDSRGWKDVYVKNEISTKRSGDNETQVTVLSYKDDKLISKHGLAVAPKKKSISAEEKLLNINKKLKIKQAELRAVSEAYEDYYVNGKLMNDIAVSKPNHDEDLFLEKGVLSEDDIQEFLEDKNSILKDDIEIWRKNEDGEVYNTNETMTPSKVIYDAQQEHYINAKVILATLQKESSLIGKAPGTVEYSARRFYFAMGMGATDGGDYDSYTGFDKQVDKGTELLYNKWLEAPVEMPVKITVNNGKDKTSNEVTYKGSIWVKNWGTYALYKYTPWTIDTSYLPTLGGGNYLFCQIFEGYWGDDWD